MPVVNSELYAALRQAQGVKPETALAAAEIVGQLEKQMIARSARRRALGDLLPILLWGIFGMQAVIILELFAR